MSCTEIAVVVGTRPEAIKMAPVVRALREADWCHVRVLATGQHRELLDEMLAFFEIAADVDLDLMQPGQPLAALTGQMIGAMDEALAELAPDLVLAQGDTTTVLVSALCCFYRDVRFGHVEAGLRTHARRSPFPEEMNRQIVDRIADLHFAPTERAVANLRDEAIPQESIILTGNTSIDALLWTAENVEAADCRPASGRRLVLVTAHRRESFGPPLERICAAVRAIADRGDVEVLFPLHPNPQVRRTAVRSLQDHPAIRLVEPLGYPRLVAAMLACHLILTDSGGIQEEAPSIGKPVLVLREVTERPEGIEAGTSLLVGTRTESIVEAASRLLDDDDAYAKMARCVHPFGDGHAAARIVEAIRARFGP